MAEVDVLIPVLERPGRVAPLMESLRSSVGAEHVLHELFLCSPGDDEEIAAITSQGFKYAVMDWPAGDGDFARKTNTGVALTDSEWVFVGADDLHFHPGWLDACLVTHEKTGALVIGVNDMGNPTVMRGHYATQMLVHRDYATNGVVDEPGLLLYEGYSHNCNTGEAPVWMGDLNFKDIRDVKVGDTVMGWKRVPAGKQTLNRFARGEVLSIQSREAPVVQVTMASGRTLRCTPDHLWLNPLHFSGSVRYQEYAPAQIGSPLLHVVDVPKPIPYELDRQAGYTAGIYDGEGSGVYIASQSTRENDAVHSAIGPMLELLDIPHTRVAGSGKDVGMYCIAGGRQGYLDFLLRIQPVKRERLTRIIFGSNRHNGKHYENAEVGGARFGHQDRVAAIEPAGVEEVFALTTETGNYIAWGYASKNCVDTEFVETARFRGTFASARDAHVEHLHHVWKKGPDDATYAKGREKHSLDRQRLQRRRHLWSPHHVVSGRQVVTATPRRITRSSPTQRWQR